MTFDFQTLKSLFGLHENLKSHFMAIHIGLYKIAFFILKKQRPNTEKDVGDSMSRLRPRILPRHHNRRPWQRSSSIENLVWLNPNHSPLLLVEDYLIVSPLL